MTAGVGLRRQPSMKESQSLLPARTGAAGTARRGSTCASRTTTARVLGLIDPSLSHGLPQRRLFCAWMKRPVRTPGSMRQSSTTLRCRARRTSFFVTTATGSRSSLGREHRPCLRVAPGSGCSCCRSGSPGWWMPWALRRSKFTRDGVLRGTVAVSGRTNFRLPPNGPAYRWSVKLTSTATVREVSLAQSLCRTERCVMAVKSIRSRRACPQRRRSKTRPPGASPRPLRTHCARCA